MKSDALSIVDLALNIKKCPHLYFGETLRFSDLYNFLNGYGMRNTPASNPPFEYFNVWIKKKFDTWGATMHWTKAILEENKNDEQQAFWKFFELLEEFKELKPLKILVSDLSEDNFAFYYSKDKGKDGRLAGPDNRLIIDPAPYHIKVVEFEYCVHAYHFDHAYAVSDTSYGKHEQSFFPLGRCLQYYKIKYGNLIWTEIQKDATITEFELIAKHGDHRNAIFHYMDGTYDPITIK